MYETSINLPPEERLPKPQGYKILIAIPKVVEKTKGGLLYTEDRRTDEQIATIVGYVVSVGPDAYADSDGGSWCKAGDWIVFRSYSGTRFMVDEQEFRIINDATVDAVIPGPEGYSRI